MSWQLLYQQFGSSNVTRSFKQSFKKAVDRVYEAYRGVNIIDAWKAGEWF